MSWVYLSYYLNDQTFGYGDGERFQLEKVRSMCCGDTSNNSRFSMPTHFGTHIDFPFHFGQEGKTSSAYQAEDFAFRRVGLVELNPPLSGGDLLIRTNDLKVDHLSNDLELLLVKTGLCYKRQETEYWERGYGFHSETAAFLKTRFPQMKVIGFDLISLNSYQHREEGRKAHKAFLLEEDILILEELDLRKVTNSTSFKQVIIASLQLQDADGAPCTVMAEL